MLCNRAIADDALGPKARDQAGFKTVAQGYPALGSCLGLVMPLLKGCGQSYDQGDGNGPGPPALLLPTTKEP